MEFSEKTIINAMKSEKYGPRLNAIKHEVDAITSEAQAISAEVTGMNHTGKMREKLKTAVRFSHLETKYKKLERRSNSLLSEWDALLLAFVNDTGKPSLQVVKG